VFLLPGALPGMLEVLLRSPSIQVGRLPQTHRRRLMFTCLECETNFDIDEDIEADDIVQCPECELRMIVLGINPPTVDYVE